MLYNIPKKNKIFYFAKNEIRVVWDFKKGNHVLIIWSILYILSYIFIYKYIFIFLTMSNNNDKSKSIIMDEVGKYNVSGIHSQQVYFNNWMRVFKTFFKR